MVCSSDAWDCDIEGAGVDAAPVGVTLAFVSGVIVAETIWLGDNIVGDFVRTSSGWDDVSAGSLIPPAKTAMEQGLVRKQDCCFTL